MSNRNIEFILDCLSPDDDEAFWAKACALFFEDAEAARKDGIPVFMEIGICSNWIKPQHSRFTDTQSLPLPLESEKERSGYARLMLPQYDWSMLFMFDEDGQVWKPGDEPSGEF